MPDQPDETQKQQRRSTALPPFFAPRTTRPTTPSQSGTAAPPRRTSQLFTPPDVPSQRPSAFKTPLATPRLTPFAAPVVEEAVTDEPEAPAAPAAHEAEPPAPAPNAEEAREAAPSAPDAPPALEAAESASAFVIEQYESPPISLRATGEQGVVSDDPSMAFQVYDDASRLLERGARPVPPDEGGIEIERSEVTFEPAVPSASRLEVES